MAASRITQSHKVDLHSYTKYCSRAYWLFTFCIAPKS